MAIATNDLRRVPKHVSIVVGGLEHVSQVRPITWETGLIYKHTDFPEQPITYPQPPPTQESPVTASDNTSSDEEMIDAEEMICCSKKALLEICMSLDLAVIPPEIRPIITGQKGSGQMLLRVLRDMVEASEDQGTLIQQNSQRISSEVAGHAQAQQQPASHMTTRPSHNEPIVPDLTFLFAENQHRELSGADCRVATNPALQESGHMPATRQQPEKGKDKVSVTFEKGQSSKSVTTNKAGQSQPLRGLRGISIREPTEELSQKILHKEKEGGHTKIHKRSHVFSRNMRFREMLVKEKGRTRVQTAQKEQNNMSGVENQPGGRSNIEGRSIKPQKTQPAKR